MFALIRRGAVFAACVLAVAMVYWGGGSSRTTGVEGTPCLDAATAEAARSPTATPEPSGIHPLPALHDNEAQCRLRRALLTRADVPGEWEEERPDDIGYAYGDTEADCGTPFPAVVAGLRFMLFASDSSSQPLHGFEQRIYAFGPGGAIDLMAALTRNCASVVVREDRLTPCWSCLRWGTNHSACA